MLYEKIKKEQELLHKQIETLQRQLATLPDGKLICSHNGKYIKWYVSDGHKKTYIPKKKLALAENLALKKYLSLTLEDLLKEENALNSYLKHQTDIKEADKWVNEHPNVSSLLSNILLPSSSELSSWMTSEYEHNPNYKDQLVHKTISGNLVRSKSEAMIDLSLFKNQIPFRYECALQLGEVTIYPDFTIKHPKTGNIYYWEHFGQMDDPSYSKKAYSKLQLYNSWGIIPSIHLITTYETKNTPLTSDLIEKVIEHYFT